LKPNSNTLIPPSIDRIDIRNKMWWRTHEAEEKLKVLNT
jgi:hypothetical protein